MPANCALSFCASCPFCTWKSDEDELPDAEPVALGAAAGMVMLGAAPPLLTSEPEAVAVGIAVTAEEGMPAEGVGAATAADEDSSSPSSPSSQPSSPSPLSSEGVAAGAEAETVPAAPVGEATSELATETGAAEEASEVEAGAGAAEEALPVELLAEPPAPGSCVMSDSCWPSGTGPLGLAGQEPGGLTGPEWPKGMVPLSPTLTLPTKVVGLVEANWHWKSPLSSEFLGADPQYGTERDVGFMRIE